MVRLDQISDAIRAVARARAEWERTQQRGENLLEDSKNVESAREALRAAIEASIEGAMEDARRFLPKR